MTGTWKQIVIAAVLGGSVGFAGAWWALPRICHHRWGDGQFQHRLLDQFSSELKLTPDQRDKVAAILEAKRQKIETLRAEMRPRFEQIRISTSAEIRQLLTPEQQQRFDVLQAKWDQQRKKWHHGESDHDGTKKSPRQEEGL